MKLNKAIEISALTVGGISLFLMSFLVFALSAGVPAHEVAIVGSLFPVPEVAEPTEDPELELARPKLQPKTPEQVLQGIIGNLPSLSGPSPFEDGEVERLVAEIKETKLQLDREREQVDKRQIDVAQREETLDEKAALIQDLMAELDVRVGEIRLQQEELDRDLTVASEAEAERWKKQAAVFKKGDAGKLAKRLENYPAEDAARILANLEEAQRNKLLAEVTDAKFTEFNAAFAALGY